LVYDVGGGKAPYLSVETKRKLGVTVTGVDIDPNELAAAPQGAYDATICGDICHLEGNQDGDIVIAVSVLEHVRDVSAALNAISTFLKPSGKALLFVPSRTALYAKLNLLLPERIKRRILEMVLPGSLSRMGFKAYYDRCTPSKLAKLARDNQLMVDTVNRYYFSPYLMFFFPLHILARLRQLLLQALSADAGVETFALILSRK
jgi:2-polyprenyl-6-hydroxyphenyl methylase/3-demethylubiquinone-9 3-methyltransferase